MKYDEIQAGRPDNFADFSPAFNTGCSSTLFNPDRDRVIEIKIKKLKRRKV